VIKRLKDAKNPKEEGQKICVELMQQLKEIDGVSGIHLMAYKQEANVKSIVMKSGVLDGRIPWFPDHHPQYGDQHDN
jgi:methylenetetrahydrofolate reductase (NADPH)